MSDEKIVKVSLTEDYDGVVMSKPAPVEYTFKGSTPAPVEYTFKGSIPPNTITLSTPNMVMKITPDSTVTFYTESGEVYLTISPDGMTDGVNKVDIGDAGVRFAEWVKTTSGGK